MLRLLLILCLLAASSSMVLAIGPYIPQADDFESYAAGQMTPQITIDNDIRWSDSGTTTYEDDPLSRYTMIETAELDGNPNNQVARVRDYNTASGKTTHLRTGFYWPNTNYISSGIQEVYVDINPLRTDGAFKIHLTEHNGWTNAGQWISGVVFGSTVGTNNGSYTIGMTNGVSNVGYMKTIQTQTWQDSGFTYSANTWYTLKMTVDASNKRYAVSIQNRGAGSWTAITPGFIEWVYDQRYPQNDPNTAIDERHAEDFYGIIFLTSTQVGDTVDFMIDNVRVVPEPSSLLTLLAGGTGLIGLARRRRI